MQATHIASRKPRRFSARHLLVMAPVALLATGAGVVSGRANVPEDQIAPGVMVGDLNLSSKSLGAARTALTQWAQKRQEVVFTLRPPPETGMKKIWKAEAQKLGLSLNVSATLDAASKIGREGVLGQISHWASGGKQVNVAARTTVDKARLSVFLKQIARVVYRRPRNARLVFSPGGELLGPHHETPGLALDKDASASAVIAAWNTFNGQSDAATGGQTGGNSLAAGAAPPATQPARDVDPQTADPQTPAANPDSAAVTPAAPPEITLATRTVPAPVTSADLKQIDGEINHFSTHFGGTGENRGSNIALAASHINGTVLRPGDIFSYNKVVGPRDDSAGFKEAPVIVKGELEPGMGGGVCQVSSTLYNAVLLSDLKIVQRSHHAFPVHYLSAGRDATVVYGEIDFQFQNNTPAPIYIAASSRHGRLLFRIFGKRDPGREVSIVLANHSVEPSPTEVDPDPSLPAGRRFVETKGHNGHRVTVYRVVRENGREVTRELISRDHYRPFPTVIAVGTRPRVAKKPRPAHVPAPVTPAATGPVVSPTPVAPPSAAGQ